jgi:hypothetical protein
LLVGLRSTWRYYLGPAFSAIVIVYLAVTVGYRFIFTAVDEAGLVCQPTETLNYIPDAGALVAFEPSDMCFATGYKVGRLERYLVWTNPDPIALAKLHQGFSTTRATCKVDPSLALNNGSVVTDARG